jgi:hypothetical protein
MPEVKTELANDSYPALENDAAFNDGLKFEDSLKTQTPINDI